MQNREDKKYLDTKRKIAGKAINRYDLIGEGDKIVVALSGGMDSLVLLETIAQRRRFIPIDYELFAVHVKIENAVYEADTGFMQSFCHSNDVPLFYKTINFEHDTDSEQAICSVCARERRNALFRFADEYDCNKIALGHHMDDAVETLIMNMLYQGNISSMPPCLSLFQGKLKIIRPLILLSDDEIKQYAQIRGFSQMKSKCRFGDYSKRDRVRHLVDEFKKISPDAVRNIYRAMSNIHADYLP